MHNPIKQEDNQRSKKPSHVSQSPDPLFQEREPGKWLLPNTDNPNAFLRNTKFGINTYRGIDSITQH